MTPLYLAMNTHHSKTVSRFAHDNCPAVASARAFDWRCRRNTSSQKTSHLLHKLIKSHRKRQSQKVRF